MSESHSSSQTQFDHASTPTVAIISSHVARGGVGLRASAFACERLRLRVWSCPTVLLAYHPGHGRTERLVTPADSLRSHLNSLVTSKWRHEVRVVLSGYLGDSDQARAVADTIRALKDQDPSLLYICDPVMGDAGGLYVPEETACAIRDELIPIADLATPNLTELAWLASSTASDTDALVEAARRLAPPSMLVTSSPAMMRGNLGILLIEPEGVAMLEHRAEPTALSGTGDLFAGLVAARLARQARLKEAASLAAASVCDIVQMSVRSGSDELLLPELQDLFLSPRSRVTDRSLRLQIKADAE